MAIRLASRVCSSSRLLKVEDPPNAIAPYVLVPHLSKKPGTLYLDPNLSVKETVDNYIRDHKVQSLEFYTMDGVKLSSSTKLDVVLGETFAIVLNGIEKFNIYFNPQDFMSGPKDPEVRLLAYKYMVENGLRKERAEALASFTFKFTKEVDALEKGTLSKDIIQSLYKQVILTRALEIKTQENELRRQVEVLREQYEDDLKIKTAIEILADRYATRRLKTFCGFIFAQFAVVQYGTYYLYSWDIMEPITCLMTIGDTCLGYFFWMVSGRKEYGLDGIYQWFFERKLNKLYRKRKLDRQEVEHADEIIKSLEAQLKN